MKNSLIKKSIVWMLMMAVMLAAAGIAAATEKVEPKPQILTYQRIKTDLVNGKVDFYYAYPQNASMGDPEGKEFENTYLIDPSTGVHYSNEQLDQMYYFTYEADKNAFVIDDEQLSFVAAGRKAPHLRVKVISKNAEGKSVTITMWSRETGDKLSVMEYVMEDVMAERSIKGVSSDPNYRFERGPATSDFVYTVAKGADLSITPVYQSIDEPLNLTYTWINGNTDEVLGTSQTLSWKNISADQFVLCEVKNGSVLLDQVFFDVVLDETKEIIKQQAIVNGANPASLFAYPHNLKTQEAKDFSAKYFSGYTNEELAQRYGFKVDVDRNFEIVSDELVLGARMPARLLVKPVSKNAEGKSVKIAMYLKETGETVYEREYVFTLIAERSVFEIVTNSEYKHEYVSGTGDVLTVAKGSDLTIKLGYQGIGETMNASYTWKDMLNDDAVIGTGNAYTLTDIQTAKEILCEVQNGSNRVETVFFNIEVDETLALKPTVKVEEQTEEQKQNNTVTVVVPDEVIEQVIEDAASTVVELPVAEAPVNQQTAVTTAKVSEEAFEKLADTNKAVSIPLDHAEVVMQPEVVKQIATNAPAGVEIEIQVEQKQPQEALNTTQLQAVANQKVAAVITADVFAKEGNTRTKIDFQGKVTLKVPFTPPAGESGHDYVMVYVASNGQTETLATYYTNGYLVFETTHFSDFVITTRTTPAPTPAPVTAVPKTGDNATPWLWMACMTLTAGCALFLIKRRQNA